MKHFPVLHFRGTLNVSSQATEVTPPNRSKKMWDSFHTPSPSLLRTSHAGRNISLYLVKRGWGAKALTNFQVLADVSLRAPLTTSKRQEHPEVYFVLPQQSHPLWTRSRSLADLSPPSWMFRNWQRSQRGSTNPSRTAVGMDTLQCHGSCTFHICTTDLGIPSSSNHVRHQGRSLISQGRFHFQIVTAFHSNASVLRQQMHTTFNLYPHHLCAD